MLHALCDLFGRPGRELEFPQPWRDGVLAAVTMSTISTARCPRSTVH
jgi:hypothetical protein